MAAFKLNTINFPLKGIFLCLVENGSGTKSDKQTQVSQGTLFFLTFTSHLETI